MADSKNRRNRESFEQLKLVPVADIPKETSSPPTENLAKLYRICQEMQEVCDANNGVGLSAVQVGLPWQLFIIKFESGFENFISCQYEPVGTDTCVSVEGCLSIKTPSNETRYFELTRFKKVKITGKKLTVDGELVDFEEIVDGFYSTVFQHEIDHHFNILISDIGKETHIYVK
jgi:peptide deformylase